MSKVRFDGLDVQAMVAYLQGCLTGRRVVNIYDAGLSSSAECYIFKLEGQQNKKDFLLLESGIRFHTVTNFQAEASSMPSPFAAKLRKHVRGLRLEQIQQIGTDRVVLFQFGAGPSKHCIILELYAKGNIILTDKDYTVLALLRSHVYKNDTGNSEAAANAVAVQVGQVYPVTYATSLVSGEKTEEAAATETAVNMSAAEFNQWAVSLLVQKAEATVSTKKKKKQQSGITLKMLLLQNQDSGVSQFGPALIEHCILFANLEPNTNLIPRLKDRRDDGAIWTDDEWDRLQKALQNEGRRVLQTLVQTGSGYVLYQTIKDGKTENTMDGLTHADKILEEFQPVLLKQHQGRLHLEYDNFSAAVEDYFDHLQHQKQQQKAIAAEKAAAAKLEKVRADQQERLEALTTQQEKLQEEAKTVQLHAENVDKALAVINSALDSGMDWDQLEKVIEVEQKQNQNPIALLIHKLDLEHDAMILRLPTTTTCLGHIDDDSKPTLDVKISLKESAHANANRLFAKYRSSKEKSQKTIEASTKALKAAEENAKRQLAEAQKRSKQTASTGLPGGKRKPYWFEKFHWFITSDNYLVLGGRDAHQNELLVKRYLRPGDAYLHADVHGAASCILRAKRRRRRESKNGKTDVVPLSEQALREAGNFTICRSSAWSSRMVTSAWWVESHQVSKTAPTGEYLTVGSFMIRGKKNFLPPSPLEMGLAVLFRLGDDDSVLRHKNERRDFALLEELGDSSDIEIALESGKEGQEENDSEHDHLPLPEPTVEKHVDSPKLVTGAGETEQLSDDDADAESNGEADSMHESEDFRRDNSAEQPQQKKRGLSARDRRMIKKYGSLEAAEKALGAREVGEEKASLELAPDLPVRASSGLSSNGQKMNKRGKKAKIKRATKKYAEQDDEDRQLAMQALQGGEKSRKKKGGKRGTAKTSEKQQEVAAETVALLVKDASAVAERFPEEVRSILAECVTVHRQDPHMDESLVIWDKFDADTLEQLLEFSPIEAQIAVAKRLLQLKQTTRVDNFSASLGGILRTIRKYGYENLENEANETDVVKRKTKAEKDVEAAKWKQTMAEEGVVDSDLDEDAVDDTTELNKLTGKPHPEDLLLSAVPVCAPYQTLSQYTYRVKLTPGNMKRGKSTKQCLDIFLKANSGKTSVSDDRQLDLIKNVGDNEWVQVICADVKISAPGASKAAKKYKASNKKSKKGK